jgi:hypothetical protein
MALPIILAYFFSSLGFLLFAYFTKNQPAIFARYCLVLFALGLPVLAWVFLESRRWKPAMVSSVCGSLVLLCLWQWTVQLRDGAAFVNLISQKRVVADYLRGHLTGGSHIKVFCDDDTIKVLAGIPAVSFVDSTSSPADAKSFLDYLRENRVEYVVYEKRNGSAAEKVFRELEEGKKEGEITNHFQLVASTSPDLRLYRTVF